VLGICYGLQLMAQQLGGEVKPSGQRGYGYGRLTVVDGATRLFAGVPKEMDVWLSHGDRVTRLPEGFHMTAQTDEGVNAFENPERNIYGVQFHPEVAHTPLGAQILRNFLFEVCGCKGDWTPAAMIDEQIERIRTNTRRDRSRHLRLVRRSRLVGCCGPSSIAPSAIVRPVFFIDNGVLREGEFETTLALLRQGNKTECCRRGCQP
jgi:GMP synthase (glutamine-hydrolysing)